MRNTPSLCLASLAIVLAVTICDLVVAQTDLLRLEISFKKVHYLESESIIVNVCVRNASDEKIKTNEISRGFGTLKFLLTDDKKNTYEENEPKWHSDQITTTIEPHDDECAIFDLLPYGVGRLPFPTRKDLPPGNYTLQATFETGKGILHSDPLEFTISKASGLEGGAHDLLRKAFDEFLTRRYDAATKTFESLREKYPASAYCPMSYTWEMSIYRSDIKDHKKADQIADTLIQKYADTDEGVSGLLHYISRSPKEMKSRKMRLDILNRTIERHAKSKVGIYARKILKKELSNE